jgi:hypothetical protein
LSGPLHRAYERNIFKAYSVIPVCG